MAQFNVDDLRSSAQVQEPVALLPEALRRSLPVAPRLVGGTTFTGKSALDAAQVHILAQACMQNIDAARQVVFGWQRQGQSLADIYLKGIAPCSRLFGEWWLADKLDFCSVTIVSTHLQQLLHDFSAEFLQEAPQVCNGWSLLLVTEPGTQHSMGLFMLSEFFKKAGWSVTLGVPQDVVDFKRLCQVDWYDAVGVSVCTDRHLKTLPVLLQELKETSVNPNLCMFVGGPLALSEPELLQGMPADVVAQDAPATVQWLAQRLSEMVSIASEKRLS
jgi:hypothetical protein